MPLPLSLEGLQSPTKAGSLAFSFSCLDSEITVAGQRRTYRSSPIVSLASGPWGHLCCTYSIMASIVVPQWQFVKLWGLPQAERLSGRETTIGLQGVANPSQGSLRGHLRISCSLNFYTFALFVNLLYLVGIK